MTSRETSPSRGGAFDFEGGPRRRRPLPPQPQPVRSPIHRRDANVASWVVRQQVGATANGAALTLIRSPQLLFADDSTGLSLTPPQLAVVSANQLACSVVGAASYTTIWNVEFDFEAVGVG